MIQTQKDETVQHTLPDRVEKFRLMRKSRLAVEFPGKFTEETWLENKHRNIKLYDCYPQGENAKHWTERFSVNHSRFCGTEEYLETCAKMNQEDPSKQVLHDKQFEITISSLKIPVADYFICQQNFELPNCQMLQRLLTFYLPNKAVLKFAYTISYPTSDTLQHEEAVKKIDEFFQKHVSLEEVQVSRLIHIPIQELGI